MKQNLKFQGGGRLQIKTETSLEEVHVWVFSSYNEKKKNYDNNNNNNNNNNNICNTCKTNSLVC